ncbi:MAG: tetratricopeptide repeat protein [Acetivibrio ethanolgignens]
MSKYDSMMKCAKARNLVNDKKFGEALGAIDDVPLEQVKVIADLNLIADVFIKNEKFDRALEVYQFLYGRVQTRRILYQLIYLSVKCGQIKEAEEYYREYIALPAQSSDRLILKYFLDKGRGAERRQLIEDLKELKKEDYIEEWAYELAKLYHKEGMEEECINECSDIIMWFGEGRIVEKAMLLKLHYVDGLDISSPKAIEETRNLAADLKLAAAIAAENDKKRADLYERDEEIPEELSEEEAVFELQQTVAGPEPPIEVEGSDKRTKMLKLLDEISGNGKLPHFALIGEDEEKITDFAKTISKGLAAKQVTKAAKLARINSSRLNEINLSDKLSQLKDGCLLVSDAGKLSINSLQSLNQMMRKRENGIVVILADEEDGLESVLRRNRKLQSMIEFEIRV